MVVWRQHARTHACGSSPFGANTPSGLETSLFEASPFGAAVAAAAAVATLMLAGGGDGKCSFRFLLVLEVLCRFGTSGSKLRLPVNAPRRLSFGRGSDAGPSLA